MENITPLGAGYVCPPDHKHALSGNCYTGHRCRCAPCRAQNTRRKDEERRLKAYGRWDRGLVSPAHAIAHLHVLVRFGYQYEAIARRAGVNARTVYRLMNGQATRCYPHIVDAILGVTPNLDDLDPAALIPGRGTHRRVQALARLGWSVQALAELLGLTRSAFSQRINPERVTVATHREVAALYEQLWNVAPTASTASEAGMILRTKRRAEAAGWVPPLAWDDIDTDEEPPTPDPDEVDLLVVELAVDGHRVALTRDERHLALRQLHAAGHNDQILARMLCVSTRTVERDRHTLGLPANVATEAAA